MSFADYEADVNRRSMAERAGRLNMSIPKGNKMKNPGIRLEEKLSLVEGNTRQEIEDDMHKLLPYSDVRWLKVCGVVILTTKDDGEYMDLTDEGYEYVHGLKIQE